MALFTVSMYVYFLYKPRSFTGVLTSRQIEVNDNNNNNDNKSQVDYLCVFSRFSHKSECS